LLVATFATLFFVPVVYSILHRKTTKTDVESEETFQTAPRSVVED